MEGASLLLAISLANSANPLMLGRIFAAASSVLFYHNNKCLYVTEFGRLKFFGAENIQIEVS